MTFKFGQRSLDNLKGLHPDLVRVCNRALILTPVDFGIIEGLRDKARQEELVAQGASWTMNSRHLHGMAIDYMAYIGDVAHEVGTWEIQYYKPIADAFKQAALLENVEIHWGGDWAKPKTDSDHIELDSFHYPDPPLVA